MESSDELVGFENVTAFVENETECVIWEWEPSYSVIPTVYLLVFTLGLLGNGVVVWLCWYPAARRKSADTFIAHLALADLAFVLSLPLWAAYAALGYRWPFGIFLCKLGSYLVLLNMYSSVFCLTCLSVDRYQAIVGGCGLPLVTLPVRRPRRRGLWLAGVWILAGVLALPALAFRRALEVQDPGEGQRTVCDMDLSSLGLNEEAQALCMAALGLSSTALGYVLPFVVMATCYGLLGLALWGHFRRREGVHRRRLLGVIAVLVLTFGLCWLPFHAVKTLDTLDGLGLLELPCSLRVLVYVAHPYTTCLAYLNSCLNPVLYTCLDPDFRLRYRAALARCRGRRRGLRPSRSASRGSSDHTQCEARSFRA
ncbi:apelin receptor B-like [Chiloscyllium plagiosum]|uniref:apelin receptor B-like n=1 Tax=Chiloscyllium plagiosum TaxID=36176 RepID=UPI001CB85B04|nr:apelin receptor B-like [Chiloscyllium plagiosum]